MIEIKSREQVKDWLQDKPRDWAQLIAMRAALRALPLAFVGRQNEEWIDRFALHLFRLNYFSWTAQNLHSVDMTNGLKNAVAAFLDTNRDLVSGPADGFECVVLAAYASARAVLASSTEEAIAESIAAIVDAARAMPSPSGGNEFTMETDFPDRAQVIYWENLSNDCSWLANQAQSVSTGHFLSAKKLWVGRIPREWEQAWENSGNTLRRHDRGYGIWTNWYGRRIRGNKSAFRAGGKGNSKMDKFVATGLAEQVDDEFWNKGPSYVSVAIQSWIDEVLVPVQPRESVVGANPSFFISYSTKDESVAREVVAILTERGYSSIAQFKDFAPGNFVRAMREGIAQTDRFIALQSKAYWESNHCQSEWDAAYARDPGATQRKIVPFLLEPAELPPIASELVYQPLFNLTKVQRKKAIIAWIEYRRTSRSPAQLRKTLAKQASPDVRLANDRIDAGPNSLFDKPLVDMDLAELPGNLRALVNALIGSLPDNTPRIVQSCLKGYHDHLVERGTQPIIGTIVPFAEAVQAQIFADKGYWDIGLESLFGSFFKRHELLITHFPLNPERELTIAETPIDETKASGGALLEPVEAVFEAMAELKSADLTTDDFDRVEAAHQAFSRDIASLPMPLPSDNVTPKRRYVLGTIGFYERLLAALGAAAGIASTPQGQAAIAAVGAAIEAFMRFVL